MTHYMSHIKQKTKVNLKLRCESICQNLSSPFLRWWLLFVVTSTSWSILVDLYQPESNRADLYKFDILGQWLQFHPTYIYDNLNIQKSESIFRSFLVEWMNGFLWRLNSWYWLFVSISSWMNSWYSFYHCVSFFVWSPLLLFRVSKVSDNF